MNRSVSCFLVASLSAPLSFAQTLAMPTTGASFDSNMFSLPDLHDPKDSYLIIIKKADGEEHSRLQLPAGSTGVRVGSSALPVGGWTWSFKTARQAVKGLPLNTPSNLALTPVDVVRGDIAVSWASVPDAEKYVVSGRKRVKASPSAEAAWKDFSESCKPKFCLNGTQASKAIPVAAGEEIEWKVEAVDQDGIVLARSEVAVISVSPTWKQSLESTTLKLQRSDTLSANAASDPATISYFANKGEGSAKSSAYQAEFALVYTGKEEVLGFIPRTSFEARFTSSGDKRESDAMRFRVGGEAFYGSNSPGEGVEVVTGLKYEWERKSKAKKAMLEVDATPIYGLLGRYWPGPPNAGMGDAVGNYTRLPSIQFAPLLSVGADVGRTIDAGTSEETEENLVRLRSKLRFNVQLNALSAMLGTRDTSGFVEGTFWYLPRETLRKNAHVSKAGLTFALTQELSLNMTYAVGREPPSFKFSRNANVGFGLKF